MSISDDESDTPFSASLSGSDLQLVYYKRKLFICNWITSLTENEFTLISIV